MTDMQRIAIALRSPLSYWVTAMWVATVGLLILCSEQLISLGTGILGITLIFATAQVRAMYVELTRASAEVREVKQIVTALANVPTEQYPPPRNRRFTDKRW
jgi:hypothetical protein